MSDTPAKATAKTDTPPVNRGWVRHGLACGKLPKGCEYVERRINAFRLQLEQAVMQAKGTVSIADAAAINSACKWERHGMLATRWLRQEMDNLSAADRLRFSAEIAKASDRRDKAIRALGLDKKPDPLATLYRIEDDAENDEEQTG